MGLRVLVTKFLLRMVSLRPATPGEGSQEATGELRTLLDPATLPLMISWSPLRMVTYNVLEEVDYWVFILGPAML